MVAKIKTTAWETLVKDGETDEWQFKREEQILEWDYDQRKYVKKGKPTTTFLPLEERGLSRSSKMTCLIKRSAISTYDLRPLSATFVQDFVIKVPKIAEFKDVYVKKTDPIYERNQTGRKIFRFPAFFMICILGADSQTVSFGHKWVKRVGKEKKVSLKEGARMIRAKEIGAILIEDPNLPDGHEHRYQIQLAW